MTREFQTVETISQLDPIVFEPIAELCMEMNKEITFLQSRPAVIVQEIYIRGTIKGLNQAKENMQRYENSRSWKTIWGIFLEDSNGNSIKLELPIEILDQLEDQPYPVEVGDKPRGRTSHGRPPTLPDGWLDDPDELVHVELEDAFSGG